MEFEEFKYLITKKDKKHFYKIKDSWGVYDCFKHIRKNGWYDIGRPLKEHEFYSIIRGVNKRLAENLIHGKTVVFPHRMGKLEIRKYERYVGLKDGKLVITYPVDWNKTLHLWYEDKEAHDNKTLVRFDDKYTYRIRYDKYNANYENQSFYSFTPHVKVRKALKESIKKGLIDSLW